MTTSSVADADPLPGALSTDRVIRFGLIVALLLACYFLLRPFIAIFVWAGIVAVIAHPVFMYVLRALNGRRAVAAGLITLLAALVLIVPAALLTKSLADGVATVVQKHEAGGVEISPPPEGVARLPLVGPTLASKWQAVSEDPQAALGWLTPHLGNAGKWLLAAFAATGSELLQFVLGVAVAGFVLARLDRVEAVAGRLLALVAQERGATIEMTVLETVRSVSQGILGVAMIQALLAGIGLLLAGVPGAGLWALLCLVLSVAQLGTLPVMLPAIAYVFATADTVTAVVFLVWALFVGTIDNVLKPIFFGRGVDVPIAVVFLGAIGGLLLTGLIGLFVGAVILVLGYKLLHIWLGAPPAEAS